MKSLFDDADRSEMLERIAALTPEAPRQWGKMNPAQMLCHCATALESGTGDRPMKQRFIGKLLMPFLRSTLLGPKPFSRNGPTDPSFVIADERDFAKEKARLVGLIQRFVQQGKAAAATQTHGFFGKLSGDEWGTTMYKHIDHHLRQFAG